MPSPRAGKMPATLYKRAVRGRFSSIRNISAGFPVLACFLELAGTYNSSREAGAELWGTAMERSGIVRRTYSKTELRHADVVALGRSLQREHGGRVVVLNLRRVQDTTTAALAGLILLRKRQIQAGGDLLLLGLSGRAHYLYEILRLARVLPRRPCIHPRRVGQIKRSRPEPSRFASTPETLSA